MKSKLFAVVGLLCSACGVWAQSSTFTYQGQLISNNIPATGLFDLRFALYDHATVGSPVGAPLTNAPTGVTNGQFLVTLDFGSSVFDGNLRWLEIGVRTNGSTNVFTTLLPRQQITATPYAVRAANYSGTVASANLTGKINDTNLSANVALLTNNVSFTRTVVASNFVGNGLFLTNLSTTNLVGTLPDARLSPNVPLLNAGTNAFLGSLSATNYYGFGGGLTNVPGRLFDFVPTGSNFTAQGNYGYLATNDVTPVTITLPLTANIAVGATIRVSGSGAAGWIIAQNANQTILLGNLLNNVGTSWTTNSAVVGAKAVAASADGSKLVAAVGGSGNIYTSTNYGVNWTTRASPLNWSGVASSADGTKLVACVNGGSIYTSTDSGANWLPKFGPANWTSVASSLDGTRLIAGSTSAGVYTSTDSGASWVQRRPTATWNSVAASANGLNMVAVASGQQIAVSADAGTNWVSRGGAWSWTCVTSSGDGSILVAGANSAPNNLLYSSADFGASWSPGTIQQSWTGLACSSDGQRVIATASGGGVYISQDSGLTWLLRGNLPTAPTYNAAASSSDGSTLVATALANGIFVSSKATTTVGTAGQLIGARLAAVELQHVGNGVFIPLNSTGAIRAK